MSLLTELLLLLAIALAGFVDSIAGGGGLISLPAYALAGLPLKMATGNNKFGNFFGTAYASYKFAKSNQVVWQSVIFAFPSSLIGSALGARLILLLPERVLSICLLILLPLAAGIMLFGARKSEDDSSCMIKGRKLFFVSAVIGFLCGCYDGFFGPGTGTFLVLAFCSFIKMDYVKASGTSKLINLASNLGSLIVFLFSQNVDIILGIKCATASIIGSAIGSKLAIDKGSRVIKPLIVTVIAAIMAKLLIELFV